MNLTCFVIQPFDDGPYDRRYKDIVEPAIKNAGFTAYRVDKDHAASIPVETIEDHIRQADAIFADITEDNANVWLEVGLAVAHGKGLCLICSKKRQKFPFDVQHRKIIRYDNESRSDFDKLSDEIIGRLKAIKSSESKREDFKRILKENEYILKSEELEYLGIVAAGEHEDPTRYDVARRMEASNFTELACNLAYRNLVRISFIESYEAENYDGHRFQSVKLTEVGWRYIEENREKYRLRKNGVPNLDDDIPF